MTGCTSKWVGVLKSGDPVHEISLSGAGGARMNVLTYGGTVRTLEVPDREGRLADVVLGFDELDSYLGEHPYFGAMVGRIAGRVPGGVIEVEGQTFALEKNDGSNHLHGGVRGFDKVNWQADPGSMDEARLTLRHHSPDGDQGYPGSVDVSVTYSLLPDNTLVVESEVLSDRATPVSLAHHSYFNLGGKGSIHAHRVQVHADHVFEVDETMSHLGRMKSVVGQACDLREARKLQDVIPGLFQNHGDLYFLRKDPLETPVPSAKVWDPISGRILTVETTETCLQFYTGKALDGSLRGKSGECYPSHAGLCLECQGYPGAVDSPTFGSLLVHPGTPQRRITRYAFSTF